MIRNNLCLVALLIFSTSLFAQEQLGLRLGNYSGVHALQLNPSWHVDGPLKWDVNIVSGGLFLEQDYIYGQRSTLPQLIRGGGEIQDANSNGDSNPNASSVVPLVFQDNGRYNSHHNLFLMAPSFMANIGSHSFGMYLSARSWSSAYRLDGDLGYQSLVDSNLFVGTIDPFQVGIADWGEAGITYATRIDSRRKIDVRLGGTAKILLGFDGASIRNHQSTDVIRQDDEIALGPTDLSMAYSTGYEDGTGYSAGVRGFGFAGDIGVSWVNRQVKDGRQHYKWKLGVSIIDIGRIRFSRDAFSYAYQNNDSSYFNTDQFEDVRDPNDLIDAINSGDNTTSAIQTGDQLGMWMPMALSVQYDGALVHKLYLSATAVIGMRFKGDAIERSDLLAVTPRFEHRWFEIGMPVSLYRWKDVSLGTYVRLGPLTIGTENLNSFAIPGKLEGSDIYFALKIHSGMFKKGQRSDTGAGCFSSDF